MPENIKRVLVADDDPDIRNLITYKLKKEGYEISTTVNGEDALGELANNEFDILILDVMMPVIDGLQVLQQLRREKNDIPVIILSAKGQEKDVVRGLDMGATDYITKPFRPAELLARVRRITGGKND